MARVISYVRKNSLKGIENLLGYTDDAVILSVKRLIENWNNRFGKDSWFRYRADLQKIALNYSAFQRTESWQDIGSEWVAPIDDDDWHLDAVTFAIDMAGTEFDCVIWRTITYDLTKNCYVSTDDPNYIRGANTSGYAVRRSVLENLTPEQQQLILNDHYNVHRYIHFIGRKYLIVPFCGGVHLITPASITAAKDHDGDISLSTVDCYKSLLPRAVIGVDEVITNTINLLLQ